MMEIDYTIWAKINNSNVTNNVLIYQDAKKRLTIYYTLIFLAATKKAYGTRKLGDEFARI